MNIIAILMLLGGLCCYAFFSGVETGLFRVARIRLIIDALSGKRVARMLLWLLNNPGLFVATSLIGNNVANYVISLSIVLFVQSTYGDPPAGTELISTCLLTPIFFIYGDLVPKSLFYQAPYFLLRRFGPLVVFFTILFLPASLVLWALGRLLEWLIGEAPETARLSLARQELHQFLLEGHDVGLLTNSQRELAQNLFGAANRKVTEFVIPFSRLISISTKSKVSEALRIARRYHLIALPVQDATSKQIVGYLRTIDLSLSDSESLPKLRPFVTLKDSEFHGAALFQLQMEKSVFGKVIDSHGNPIGLVFLNDLTELLLTGELTPLRRT